MLRNNMKKHTHNLNFQFKKQFDLQLILYLINNFDSVFQTYRLQF